MRVNLTIFTEEQDNRSDAKSQLDEISHDTGLVASEHFSVLDLDGNQVNGLDAKYQSCYVQHHVYSIVKLVELIGLKHHGLNL